MSKHKIVSEGFFLKELSDCLAVVAHTFDPSIQKAKQGDLCEFERVPRQLEHYKEKPCFEKQKNKQTLTTTTKVSQDTVCPDGYVPTTFPG